MLKLSGVGLSLCPVHWVARLTVRRPTGMSVIVIDVNHVLLYRN